MANITDVARLAGVSHQTVSRVLNNDAAVRPQTRARVQAAIDELNYRPSAVARALKSSKTHTIGLISTGNPLYGPSSIALAFNESAREAGYQVITASMSSAPVELIRDAIDVFLRQQVEAIVLIATDVSSLVAVHDLYIDIPLITADSSGHERFPSVSIAQAAGAALATGFLADLGHRTILHLAGPEYSLDARERVRGWRAELDRRGLEARPPTFGDWTAGSGLELGLQLPWPDDFSAVFVANDQMALGLLRAFGNRGIRVPEDVSVVGFDDIPESAHYSPPLTTVRQDFAELGRRLMAAVSTELAGLEQTGIAVTQPSLVVRQSAIAPRDN
ncbi:LacI family DNA-binding transcriptional regulator [Lacisediminihabitans changchengi]|uniref:LacI family DNA-binding transcriptional regulator n=1 Tax=Lacisediminihabitans changchengi TaxID=2787634 RepID=A0A934SUD4_9MICO|nr:LacI family DNA-binding transcriptional regulator [Lacisediminihabitans changchengi]MBK4349133.1 LacI family DNA-binding transcriptional regulator [Lacisediminihabitans changchengi]